MSLKRTLKIFLQKKTIIVRCILKKSQNMSSKIFSNCAFNVKIDFKLFLCNFLAMVIRGSLKFFWFKHLSLVPNLILHIPRLPIANLKKNQNQNELNESMKKTANHAKDKILFKDYIFHMIVFYWFILHFSHSFKNWISNFRPNMRYNMIKT